MPPKPKHTREQIIAAALELVSEKGMETLTARELGARLGTSARPIFTAFKNMEEVQQEVIAAAAKRFQSYAQRAVHFTPAFKQLGMQALLFAAEEPKLYQLLFMRGDGTRRSFDQAFSFEDSMSVAGMQMLQKQPCCSAMYGFLPLALAPFVPQAYAVFPMRKSMTCWDRISWQCWPAFNRETYRSLRCTPS